MATPANPTLPAPVRAVRDRIEHWRKARAKRTAMPEDLWAAAVSLAGEHGVYRISRDLRLDYSTLKLRAFQAETARQRTVPTVPTGFVELDTASLLGAPAAASIVVELSRPDGSRAVITLPADQAVDVVGLSAAFWEGGG